MPISPPPSAPPPAPPTLTTQPKHHQHSCLALSSTLITYLHTYITEIHRASPQSSTVLLSIGSGTGLLERYLLDPFDHAASEGTLDEEATLSNGKAGVHVFGVEVRESEGGAAGMVGLNGYLPPERRISVRGTWDILGAEEVKDVVDGINGSEERHDVKSGDAEYDIEEEDTICDKTQQQKRQEKRDLDVVLMFIYPRQAALVRKYIERYGHRQSNSSTVGSHGEDSGALAPRVRLLGLIWAGPRADWEDEYENIFEELGNTSTFYARENRGDGLMGWDVQSAWGDEVGVALGEGVVTALLRTSLSA